MPPTNDSNRKRILALDVMRGITIAGMILVNNPADTPYARSCMPTGTD